MMHDISIIPSSLLNQWPGTDQGLYTQMFLAGIWNIQIDYSNNMFQSFGLVNDKYEPQPQNITSRSLLVRVEDKSSPSGVKWKNQYNQNTPAIIHFNADGKSSGMFRTIASSVNTINPTSTHEKNIIKNKCKKFHKVY